MLSLWRSHACLVKVGTGMRQLQSSNISLIHSIAGCALLQVNCKAKQQYHGMRRSCRQVATLSSQVCGFSPTCAWLFLKLGALHAALLFGGYFRSSSLICRGVIERVMTNRESSASAGPARQKSVGLRHFEWEDADDATHGKHPTEIKAAGTPQGKRPSQVLLF